MFHSKSAASLSNWIGIVTAAATGLSAAFTVLSKLSESLFGRLTWPEAILIGVSEGLAVLLMLAVVLAIVAWAVRRIWPAQSRAFNLPILDHKPDPYDDSAVRKEIAALTGRIDKLGHQIEVVAQQQLSFTNTQGEWNELLDKRVTGLQHELDDHKKHMSDCYSAQDEARQHGLRDLKLELKAIQHGCADLGDRIKAVHNEMRESVNAILVQDKLAALAAELVRIADELYLPLKDGETYDGERWGAWLRTEAYWEGVLDQWVDAARWYDQGVKINVLTVRDREYDEEKNWGVQDAQFPNADAVRQYKRHRLLRAHWEAVKDSVDRNVLMVAHGAISEKECHNGQYHR